MSAPEVGDDLDLGERWEDLPAAPSADGDWPPADWLDDWEFGDME